jgi:hypothetical protein
VRSGAVLPLLPPDVDTLAEHDGKGLVSLDDRADRLALLAFPRGDTKAAFGEGGRIASKTGKRSWKLEVRGAGGGRFDLQASLAGLSDAFEPCRVTLDGDRLAAKRWGYDAKKRVLTARFDGRAPVVVVKGRGC